MPHLLPRLLEISDDPSTDAMRRAANELILATVPFPFQDLLDRFPGEQGSYRRANLLWLLHLGASRDEQVKTVVALAQGELRNQAPGVRRYERLAPEGTPEFVELRICDVACNILIQRVHLAREFDELTLETPVQARNRVIVQLDVLPDARPDENAPPSPAEITPHRPVTTGNPNWRRHLALAFALALASAALFRVAFHSPSPQPAQADE
jgi:hypothetical protein